MRSIVHDQVCSVSSAEIERCPSKLALDYWAIEPLLKRTSVLWINPEDVLGHGAGRLGDWYSSVNSHSLPNAGSTTTDNIILDFSQSMDDRHMKVVGSKFFGISRWTILTERDNLEIRRAAHVTRCLADPPFIGRKE